MSLWGTVKHMRVLFDPDRYTGKEEELYNLAIRTKETFGERPEFIEGKKIRVLTTGGPPSDPMKEEEEKPTRKEKRALRKKKKESLAGQLKRLEKEIAELEGRYGAK